LAFILLESNIYLYCTKINKIMSYLNVIENNEPSVKKAAINWADSPSIKRLLDVISSIIAKEYIATAKKNPGIFTEYKVNK